jgi:hypothetical protein
MEFNTIYKIGDKIFCKKSLIYRGDIFFTKNRYYTVKGIDFSRCSMNSNQTVYGTFYFIKGSIFCSNETFVTNEISHGASGMSGCGDMDEYFCDIKELRKEKLTKIGKI